MTYKVIILIIVFLQSFLAFSQQYDTKVISVRVVQSQLKRSQNYNKIEFYKKSAFNVEQNIRFNWAKDATDIIQNVLNDNSIVLLPNCKLKISDKGLSLMNNQVLIFQENTIMEMLPSSKERFSLLDVINKYNVEIYHANLIGDKFKHRGKSGQWGFGINIIGSRNVKIYSPYIRETWGDGIYIGQSKKVPSSKIYVYNAVIDNARRNGISITSADGVIIKDTYIANTHGQSPQSGIDLEPNFIYDEIKNINIINLTTLNNKWAGILMVFENFKSNTKKNISVLISGHTDIGSKYGIAMHGYSNDKSSRNLHGEIKISKLNYSQNRERYYFYNTHLSKIKLSSSIIEFKNKFNKHKLK